MKLNNVSVIYGLVLILLGLVGYFGFGRVSFTALIPAFLGVLILIAGILARDEKRRRHAMHVAAALSLIGFIGSIGGVIPAFQYFTGSDIARPAAAISRAIMSLLSLAFLILCVSSFIQARRRQ